MGSVLRQQGLFDLAPATSSNRTITSAQLPSPDLQPPGIDADQPLSRGVIIRFRDPATQSLAEQGHPPPDAMLAAVLAATKIPIAFSRAMIGRMHVFRFDQALGFADTQSIVQQLAKLPIIEHVEADFISRHQAESTDPYFVSSQWNLMGTAEGFAGGIDAKLAWEYTTGASDTVVAVVDSGVLPHPELAGRLLPGYDFISDATYSNDGNGRDADATDPGSYSAAGECGPGSEAQRSSWHGTHVSGIVAADGANGSGIAGVSWRTRILPVRVLGKCGGTLSDLLDGLYWAAGLRVPGVPDNPHPAQIINLSLGGYSGQGCTRAYQDAINQVIGQGALIVVAAGNAADDVAHYTPASCEGVLTVMAVDPYGDLASYSNYSFSGHVSAPGGDMNVYGTNGGILSTVGSGTKSAGSPTWAYMQGTSMAAPHVSGVAALALSMNPGLSGPELSALIQLTARAFPSYSYCATYGICGSGIASAIGAIEGATALAGVQLVYEFYNSDLEHYFRTGSKAEAALINGGSAGPGWYDTLDYFYAWSNGAEGALPVCRFYGTPGVGPNSHFYTADAKECEQVKHDPGWTYEGIAFYARLPENGACRQGERPVYRAYNNRWMYNDSNHRYTTDFDAYQALVASGWAAEGVALCSAN
ncbi:S8 family peptidase [Azoarcus sp. L1K30]|uniref:S8 family peptidase n=1 Tax=Azoarcus sp. L1K30 TaxID=2820277 RepID=UPI001B81FB86|nr:S8 family peptidase [Azoarcus sp. L1K30]MBR0565132.1 S8 family peptidase [Azoarcus sp. L1K30]